MAGGGQQIIQTALNQGRAGDDDDIGLSNRLDRLLRRAPKGRFIRLEHLRVLVNHPQLGHVSLEGFDKRHKAAHHGHFIFRLHLGGSQGIHTGKRLSSRYAVTRHRLG